MASKRRQASPGKKKNLETETTLSRLTKRLTSYESDISMRLHIKGIKRFSM
jgi:hypothetical protein